MYMYMYMLYVTRYTLYVICYTLYVSYTLYGIWYMYMYMYIFHIKGTILEGQHSLL